MPAVSIERLEVFARAYPFKPYHYYHDLDPRRVAGHFARQLDERMRSETAYVWAADDVVRGVLVFDDLPWDSGVFGLPMARVDLYVCDPDDGVASSVAADLLDHIDEPCAERGIRHVVCKVNTQDLPAIHALEDRSYRLVDTMTVMALRPDEMTAPTDEADAGLRIREMREDDVVPLSDLSRAAFTDRADIQTRFTSDPLLADRAGDLYSEWLKNSYRGGQADVVLVAEVEGQRAGFITCKLSDGQTEEALGVRLGSIPLNAVDSRHRRRGVYRRLVVEAIEWFRRQGASRVEIRTQVHTLGVHRTWQQLNGRLVDSYHVFHQWRAA